MKKRIKKEKKPILSVREVDRRLHAACSELNIGHIRAAIEAGADVNAPDETGEFAPLDIVADSLNGWDDYRFNPDYQRQIRNIVEMLLSNGANPNGIYADERPLMVFSWSCCDPKICALLLRYGAKVNFECTEAHTPLDLVIEEMTFLSVTEGSEEVIQRLEKIYDIFERHHAKQFYDPDFKDAFKQQISLP
jgi:ankyrin repeat protein